MQSDDIAQMLYDGAVAVQQGDLERARELLLKVIELDEENEQAWLWLSGAVDDPSDQQVALENVLALNPNNTAAQAGLLYLQRDAGMSLQPPPAADDDWTPPPPLDENEVLELSCWQCQATLYSVAPFCWQCNTPVHSCNNCVLRHETRCKALQGLTAPLAQSGQNECPWWRPAAT
jgi:tetratricopeptide (TPR) repeat protein